ncbi:integrase [Pelatocladus sp. BLCC-F211]|uniref:integrase n=1 Tax=Pelatocladus sp. BLCC-F211 TaxID=3342752 RepID=UPI0035B77A23
MKWTLEAVNTRLKAGKIGVAVRQRGDRLSLRATLPPKPGSNKEHWHQQDISLGIYANVAGLQAAEAEAKLLGGRIASGEFNWSQYLEGATQKSFSCGYWIDKFREDYFAQKGDDTTKRQTWKEHYERYFNKLPTNENLTPEILIAIATTTEANTWTRRTMCQKLAQLARFSGVSVDLKRYQGNYSSAKQMVRKLPSDETIFTTRDTIPHPEWQWAYGMMAVYGLRPHEIFFASVDPSPPYICTVYESKTDFHISFPLPLEWVERWQLWENKIPSQVSVEGRTKRDLGSRVQKALKRYNAPFRNYDLRHAYAIRAAKGFDMSQQTFCNL